MRILLTERFQRDIRNLSEKERSRCFEVILALPGFVGRPHEHSGISLRKLHAGGVWEARLGLGLRLVFGLKKDEAVLATVGTHEDVRKYIVSL